MERYSFPSAASLGNVDLVKKLIESGENVNSSDPDGSTSLHLAITSGKNSYVISHIINLLLEAGASVHARNKKGYTPLHLATINADSESVNRLLAAGAEADAEIDVEGVTSFRIAFVYKDYKSSEGYREIVYLLAEAGASVIRGCVQGPDSISPLRNAVISGNINDVEKLIDGADVNAINWYAGASPNIDDFYDRLTPLHAAIIFGSVKRLELLIKAEANLDTMTKKGSTSLHLAISSENRDDENFDLIQLLVKSGASLTQNSAEGFDALQTAVSVGKVKVVQFLIESGADVFTIVEKTTDNCLHIVVKSWSGKTDNDRIAIIELLINAGIPVDVMNSGGITPLYCALDIGNVQLVEYLIQAGANVNMIDASGGNSIHHAIPLGPPEENHSHIISLLVNAGASVNIRNNDGRAPLDFTVLTGKFETSLQLIKAGADVNAVSPYLGNTCLHILAQFIRFNLEFYSKGLKFLIENGASLEVRNKCGQTPLHLAIWHSDLEGIENFIKAGADVNATDEIGQNSLHLVIKSGKTDIDCSKITKLLLEANASVDNPDKEGTTPLQLAAASGRVLTVKCLIKAKANVNAVDSKGATSLHCISTSTHFNDNLAEIIRLLMANEASLDSRENLKHFSPLHCAVYNGNFELVEHYIKLGADVNAVCKDLKTCLHLALDFRRFNDNSHWIIKLLLKSGALLNARDKDGYTPLMFAIFLGDVELLEQLIKSGADAKAINARGQSTLQHVFNTSDKISPPKLISILLKAGAPIHNRDKISNEIALHYAVTFANVKAVEQLIRAGSDVNAVNQEGRSCLHMVFSPANRTMEESSHGIVCLLLKAGAKLEIRDDDGRTPLVDAVILGETKFIQQLIRSGADASIIDTRGLSILHHAVRSPLFVNDCVDVIPLLLEAGASLEIHDYKGRTPLTLAASYGCTRMVEGLIEAGADVNAIDLEDRTVLHHVLDDELSPDVTVEVKCTLIRLLLGSGAKKYIDSNVSPRINWIEDIEEFYEACNNDAGSYPSLSLGCRSKPANLIREGEYVNF
ncbi:hypothetical protein QAD02_009668 [Eretmocerus hayati]|uniref:Uncharacterized protein n=1 Tax=Eretmocerus hayati TaxID=131215 RepID=A0ACC2NA04_9HYME|nr:hypothetical protein QAD02_009668 [Eretmocerus hayati]